MDRYNPAVNMCIRKGTSDTFEPITQMPTCKAIQNLGIRIAPDGNMNDKCRDLEGKASLIYVAFRKLHLNFGDWHKAFLLWLYLN